MLVQSGHKVCVHPKLIEGEKLRPMAGALRIFTTFKCPDCFKEWETMTNLIQYGRSRNEERFELTVLDQEKK